MIFVKKDLNLNHFSLFWYFLPCQIILISIHTMMFHKCIKASSLEALSVNLFLCLPIVKMYKCLTTTIH